MKAPDTLIRDALDFVDQYYADAALAPARGFTEEQLLADLDQKTVMLTLAVAFMLRDAYKVDVRGEILKDVIDMLVDYAAGPGFKDDGLMVALRLTQQEAKKKLESIFKNKKRRPSG